MVELDFVKLSPTKNITILVDTPVERTRQRQIAERLMAEDSVHAEQVGFIEKPQNPAAWARLQMMGGEFCGNAVMSLAVLLCHRKGLKLGEWAEVHLETSGAKGLLACEVTAQDGHYLGNVRLPIPYAVEDKVLQLKERVYKMTILRFAGITHVLIPTRELECSNPREFAEQAVRTWQDLCTEDAMGILLYEEENDYMDPLVYVKATGSLVWEQGCGSGSAAVGVYLALRSGASICRRISQPGGEITVRVAIENNKVTDIQIEGHVWIVAAGTAFLN